MTYELRYETKARKEIRALKDKELLRRLDAALLGLQRNPFEGDVKKLVGWKDRWRLRIGDYRIVYSVEKRVLIVLVITVAKRGEVYLKLGR